jgi:TPP-dependent pyruvate/acetoin dehydrogenase alpha subunit
VDARDTAFRHSAHSLATTLPLPPPQEWFSLSDAEVSKYDKVAKADILKAYRMMELARQFENACNQAYMQVRVKGGQG